MIRILVEQSRERAWASVVGTGCVEMVSLIGRERRVQDGEHLAARVYMYETCNEWCLVGRIGITGICSGGDSQMWRIERGALLITDGWLLARLEAVN